MAPRDLRNIRTTGNSCRDALPCENMALKLPRCFLPADGEPLWWLLPSSVSLLSGGTVQPENIYSLILKVTGEVWQSQKRISISTNHSYHQRSSPQTNFNWSKARFRFNQPNNKSWFAKLVDVKHLIHNALLSLHHH